MADGYLERREAEARAPRRSVVRYRPAVTGAVFIADGLSVAGTALVKEYAARRDHRVAFAGADYRLGTRLAQATGARFYPVEVGDSEALQRAFDDAREHFAPLDIIML